MNKDSTRFYSSRQEKKIAKVVGGNVQSNSGATLFSKGDVKTDSWLFEAKTCVKEQSSFSIKKEWLEKLKGESFAMKKLYYALAFNFGPETENYYIIDERVLKEFMHEIKIIQEFFEV